MGEPLGTYSFIGAKPSREEFKKLFSAHLRKRYPELKFEYQKENGQSVSARYEIMSYQEKTDLIGISTNLGNPKGFTKQALNALGNQIFRELNG